MSSRQAFHPYRRTYTPPLPAATAKHPRTGKCRRNHYRSRRRAQKSGDSGFRVAGSERTGSHPPFALDKPGRRNGHRPRRLCGCHFQTRHCIHQHPYHPACHGRRIRRRKTGINFNGLKNEIGVFAPASSVLLETGFLRSLDARNFFSGYAEMLKHGLISTSDHLAELLSFDTENIDYSALRTMVGRSVQVKEDIVEQDPKEHGIRKALNLGHTIGHAFESLALAENRPVLHGYAVAWGLVCELYLSYLKAGFPKDKMRQTIQFIKENYGAFAFSCKQYDSLYELMLHDKKNTAGIINFTLLKEVGDICLNQTADKETIFEVFDFYRECMGV